VVKFVQCKQSGEVQNGLSALPAETKDVVQEATKRNSKTGGYVVVVVVVVGMGMELMVVGVRV
jgi:hypothetical protein